MARWILACLAVVVAGILVVVPSRPPGVAAVHPGADVLPSNHLRFYVDFTVPMAEGDPFGCVRLLDEAGAPIEDGLRHVEAWSRGGRRLMVYVHPGRIKRDLEYGRIRGPVLEEGKRYTFEVAPGLATSDGRRADGARKNFLVGPPDREQPDPSAWRVEATRGRVVIELGDWLDRAGLEEWVTIEGVASRAVVEGRRVTLHPSTPLSPGEHALVVNPLLEDTCGNSVARPFESRGESAPRPSRVVFRVR